MILNMQITLEIGGLFEKMKKTILIVDKEMTCAFQSRQLNKGERK